MGVAAVVGAVVVFGAKPAKRSGRSESLEEYPSSSSDAAMTALRSTACRGSGLKGVEGEERCKGDGEAGSELASRKLAAGGGGGLDGRGGGEG